jgi:hypothetical protein
MAEPAVEQKKTAGKPKATVVLRENESRSLIDWTPSQIKLAEIYADRGNLQMAADLVELILTDDRAMGATEALTSVVSLPLKFEPEDSPVSLALTGREGDWWQMMPEPELKKLIKWGRILGIGFAYNKGWFRAAKTGRLIPDIEVWHPRNFYWDKTEQCWHVRLADGSDRKIEPGDPNWIIYSPYGKKRPWADAPWRGLSRWWLIKRYAQHDWAGYSERQGNGTEVITEELPNSGAPGLIPVQQDPVVREKERAELVGDLKKLRRNAKLVLPAGYGYKLIESVARTWETFKAQKECADTAIAIAIVGQNLSTEVKGGSLAAAEVHEKVEWRVIRDVAESVSTMAHKQVLPTYVAYNFGPNESVPWLLFDTKPPEDLKASTEALVAFSTAIQNFKVAGYKVTNLEEVSLKYGVTLEEIAAPEPPNGAAGTQNAAA